MKAQQALTELDRRGVILTLTASGLRYSGPAGAMTPALRAALVANKAEVRRRLEVQAAASGPVSAESEETPANLAESGPGSAREPGLEIVRRANVLLARIDAGDVAAVAEYAELAQAQGWPCFGVTADWATEAEILAARLAIE